MIAKACTCTILFFIVIGLASALENYMDYGNESPNSDKSANLQEFYRMLVQRSPDADSLRELAEHLQPRAAERSPSLRLRFGRSYLKSPRSPSLRLRFGRSYPSQVLSRLNDGGSSAAAFEEN